MSIIAELATAGREIRRPAYRYHDIRPAGGVPLTEWAIERQLSLAADYGQQDLVDVLVAMNPDLDESIALDIERLLDTADAVRDAELNGTRAQHDWCIDEYAGQLRKLAKLVRGAR